MRIGIEPLKELEAALLESDYPKEFTSSAYSFLKACREISLPDPTNGTLHKMRQEFQKLAGIYRVEYEMYLGQPENRQRLSAAYLTLEDLYNSISRTVVNTPRVLKAGV